jgi:thiol-disulfide isomerase/thioredoxin
MIDILNTARLSLIALKSVLLVLLCSLCLTQVARAADWTLQDKDGVRYKLSALKGKWVLVNFWAPWCSDCLEEMPDLDAIQKQHKDLQVIGVAVMYRKTQEVMDVLRAHSVSYPVVMGNEDIASNFGEMKGMPTSFLYSPAGILIEIHEGHLTQEKIEQIIR